MLRQQQEQKQKLSLDVQQIQQIKLLEVSGEELADRIQEELASNPALEVVTEDQDFDQEDSNFETEDERPEYPEDFAPEDFTADDEREDAERDLSQGRQEFSSEVDFVTLQSNDAPTLREELEEQMITLPLTAREQQIAEYIIGNLNDDGYLSASLRELSDALLFNEQLECSDEEIEKVIAAIQTLEPAGVATRSLQESLLQQLSRQESNPIRQYAIQIVSKAFDDLAKRNYQRIMEQFKLSEEDFTQALQAIRSLNPRPASGYGTALEAAVARIVPDFTVHLQDGALQLWLNDAPNLPQLGISPAYLTLSQTKPKNSSERSNKQFAVARVLEAKGFIDALRRRRQTLLLVVGEIVQAQESFFRTGDIHQLRPLVLRDIAERVSLDISSISRITQRKYIQTDHGIYPLKYFFSEGMLNSKGEAISSRSTKERLQQLIASEDKSNPLSDAELAELLTTKGAPIARRTIAKYREQLGIPIARLRREL